MMTQHSAYCIEITSYRSFKTRVTDALAGGSGRAQWTISSFLKYLNSTGGMTHPVMYLDQRKINLGKKARNVELKINTNKFKVPSLADDRIFPNCVNGANIEGCLFSVPTVAFILMAFSVL